MSKENTSEFVNERQIPADIDAERSLLGGILHDYEAMETAMKTISNDDFFYLERHQLIWSALCNLNKADSPIDLNTLSDELTKMGKLDTAGGREYIFELMELETSAANVPWLLEHLRSKAILRKLIRTSSEIIRQALNPSSSSEEVLQDAKRDIFTIDDDQSRDSLLPIENYALTFIEKLNNCKYGITGIRTGITELDQLTNGLQNSDLIILAARPGVGKTSFALTIASNAAIKYQHNVAFFSLEMDGVQSVQRLFSSHAQIDLNKLRNGNLNSNELKRLLAAIDPIRKAPLYVDDDVDIDITKLTSKARQLKKKGKLDLLIVDNLQLMNDDTNESRAVASAEIARKLKHLAKELQIPIIVLALLSSKAYEQSQLSDLREAGSIERFADMVWFIERPFVQTNREEDLNKAKLIVAKNRNSSVKEIDLRFVPEYMTFYDAENNDEYSHDFGEDPQAVDFDSF